MDEQQPVHPDGLTATEIAELLWLASLVGPRGGAAPDGSDADAPALPDTERPPPAEPTAQEGLRDGIPAPPLSGQDDQAWTSSDAAPPPASLRGGMPADGAEVRLQRQLARPLSPPRGRALADPLLVERALRPLRRRGGPTRVTQVLDEEATAERAVEGGLWLPVLRPASERAWTEVVLVVDDCPSMVLWRAKVREFTELLSRLGAFGSVRTVQLLTGPGDGSGPDGAPAVPRLRSRSRDVHPSDLGSPARSRLILVLTDGLGPAWLAGTVTPLLHHLGRRQALAVLQVMPSELWRLTGVSTALVRLRVSAKAAPASNAALHWSDDERRPPDLRESGGSGQTHVPVPVLEIDGGGLHIWARLMAGRNVSATDLLPVMAATREPPLAPPAGTPLAQATGADVVRRARGTLSPAVFLLAVRLASVPQPLHTVRRVLPGSPPEHLGELLAFGLLRYVPEQVEGTAEADAAHFPFDFKPGVREELLAHGTLQETTRVVREVIHSMPAELWSDGQRFLIDTLDGREPPVPEITDGNRESVALAATVLTALSGPYGATVRRTRAALRQEEGSAAPDEGPQTAISRPGHTAAEAAAPSLDVPEPPPVSLPRPEPRLASTIWGAVPPRNVHFIGRQDLLDTLHGLLAPDRSMETAHVLTGLGGVGKTQLAVEYVYRHSSEYDLVWWIRAERPSTILSGFHDLATALGLPLAHEAAPHDAVSTVREALRAGDLRRRWLLVFDNAESVEDVRPFLPLGGPGAVLVTARSSQWAHVARALEVHVFHREESTALVRRRLPLLDEHEADALAETLGDLPLALAVATAWLVDTGMPTSEYLALFQRRVTALLDETPPYDYEHSVNAAWNLALDRLREENLTAVELLHTLAWLAPEPVPTSAFRHRDGDHGPAGGPLAVSRAVRAINHHSLARIDHQTGSLQLHRLLRMVLRSSMSDGERETSLRTARSLAASLPPSTARTAHLLACRAVESRDSTVRSALLDQLRWLAAKGLTHDEYRLAGAVHEEWSRTDTTTPAELTELARHLPFPP
ncbi:MULTISPECIES: FxSxx-COOH system tetratricopeptide repeat protein [unclassified Streptomyces]|uniref:FxSxx-COOH system tetratricopeptide repeat protein n=1 Tax=unclassified Streptomyces TaxID=2593676 RepID=UPI0035E379B2